MEEFFEEVLEKMNRRFSEDMSCLNDKIDAKFEALEKRIVEFIKSESMTDGMTEDSTDLEKKLETLASEISKLKENDRMFDLQMKDISCQLKQEFTEISAEIKNLQEKGDVSDVEATLKSLESLRLENIELQKNTVHFRQAQWEKIDSDMEHLRCGLNNVGILFVAHNSAYTNCLNSFTHKMDLLNHMTSILKQQVDTLRRLVDAEEGDMHQLVLDMQEEINIMSERSESVKKQMEDYMKDVESESE